MEESLVTHVSTGDNLGDLATKPITGGIERLRLVDMMLRNVESNSVVDDNLSLYPHTQDGIWCTRSQSFPSDCTLDEHHGN